MGVERVNILFIVAQFYPSVGGTQNIVFMLAKKLVEVNHNVYVMCLLNKGGKKKEKYKGINIIRIPNINIPGFRLLSGNFYLLFYLPYFIKKYNINITQIFHVLGLGTSFSIVSKIFSFPYICSIMGKDTADDQHPTSRILYPIMSFVMNTSCITTSPSKIILKYAYKQGLKNKSIIIPHFIDKDRIKKFNVDRKNNIFALQRLDYRKRVDILLSSFKIVKQKRDDMKLFIGGKGPDEQRLKEFAKKESIKDVSFLGFIPNDELEKYYEKSKIFVMHSTFEIFGLVFLEAMYHGTPIVSTNVGAIPEVLNYGEFGIIVKPMDPEKLAKGILRILDDEKLYNDFQKKYELNIDKYFLNNIIHEYLKLYNKYSN